MKLPWGVSLSGIYSYGSGSHYATTIANAIGVPYNKPGTNRLNIGLPLTIPASVRDRFEGPEVVGTGETTPRNALVGLRFHKVDLRVTKRIELVGQDPTAIDRGRVQSVQSRELRGLQRPDHVTNVRIAGTEPEQQLSIAHGSARVPATVLTFEGEHYGSTNQLSEGSQGRSPRFRQPVSRHHRRGRRFCCSARSPKSSVHNLRANGSRAWRRRRRLPHRRCAGECRPDGSQPENKWGEGDVMVKGTQGAHWDPVLRSIR